MHSKIKEKFIGIPKTLDELKECYFGPIGTQKRDEYEADLKRAIDRDLRKIEHDNEKILYPGRVIHLYMDPVNMEWADNPRTAELVECIEKLPLIQRWTMRDLNDNGRIFTRWVMPQNYKE